MNGESADNTPSRNDHQLYLITQNPVPELQSFKCNFQTGFEISSNINTMLTISLQLVHDHSIYQAEAPSQHVA